MNIPEVLYDYLLETHYEHSRKLVAGTHLEHVERLKNTLQEHFSTHRKDLGGEKEGVGGAE